MTIEEVEDWIEEVGDGIVEVGGWIEGFGAKVMGLFFNYFCTCKGGHSLKVNVLGE